MGGTFTSWGALEKALQKELAEATEEAVQDVFLDLQLNVSDFYSSPEGRYKRTEQLRNSPKCSVSSSGNTAAGEVWLDTGFRYNPSGRDTETIYGYAENGGLIGKGGFWERTEGNADILVNNAFERHFG